MSSMLCFKVVDQTSNQINTNLEGHRQRIRWLAVPQPMRLLVVLRRRIWWLAVQRPKNVLVHHWWWHVQKQQEQKRCSWAVEAAVAELLATAWEVRGALFGFDAQWAPATKAQRPSLEVSAPHYHLTKRCSLAALANAQYRYQQLRHNHFQNHLVQKPDVIESAHCHYRLE